MISRLNPTMRQCIALAANADSSMCWNCSSCDAECPVAIATDRLRPQRIVRFANLGLFADLIALNAAFGNQASCPVTLAECV